MGIGIHGPCFSGSMFFGCSPSGRRSTYAPCSVVTKILGAKLRFPYVLQVAGGDGEAHLFSKFAGSRFGWIHVILLTFTTREPEFPKIIGDLEARGQVGVAFSDNDDGDGFFHELAFQILFFGAAVSPFFSLLLPVAGYALREMRPTAPWPAFRLQNEVRWGQPRAASFPTDLSCRSRRPELAETVAPALAGVDLKFQFEARRRHAARLLLEIGS